jgi:hypothetical protein
VAAAVGVMPGTGAATGAGAGIGVGSPETANVHTARKAYLVYNSIVGKSVCPCYGGQGRDVDAEGLLAFGGKGAGLRSSLILVKQDK